MTNRDADEANTTSEVADRSESSSGAGAADFLTGGGDMGVLIRGFDWASTSLGPINGWPQSLRTAVGMILLSPVPIVMLWGEDGVMIYNDAYSIFAGGRHPRLLGSKVREGWPEVADFNDNVMKVGLAGGALSYKDQGLTLYRHGRPEEVWMNLDYSPVLDESGKPAGVIAIVVERTKRVLGERRVRESEGRFRALVNATSDVVYRMSADWTEMRQLDGRGFLADTEQPSVRWIDEYLFPEDQPYILSMIDEAIRTKGTFELEHRVRRVDGSVGWTFSRAIPLLDATGEIIEWFGIAGDVTERKRAEALRTAQNRALELAVQDTSLRETLEGLVRALEEQSSNGVIGSILLLDPDGVHLRHGAGSNLPDAYNEAIDGIAIGPGVGSCGTAAHGKRAVYVSDIASDPLWKDFRDLAMEHGLRACWSIPILSGGGQVLGTFAMYYREPREPMPQDLDLVDFVTRSAALVIERKRAEQALRASEAHLSALVGQTAAGVAETDLEGRFIRVNDRYCAIVGRSREQLLGMRMQDITHPDDLPDNLARFRRLVETGESFEVEKRYRGPDGAAVWVNNTVSFIRPPGGEAGSVLAVSIDISDRRQAEQALRESEKRFRNMADNAPVMMWVTERDGDCSYLNRSWYEFTGQSPGEAEGFGWLEAVHPDDRGWSGETFLAANEKQEAFRLEYRLRRHDGEYRWAIDAASPRFGPGGEFLGYIGSVIDIDERREAEDALRASEARFRTLANVVPTFVWFAKPDGDIEYLNDRWYEYTGQTPQEALPNGWASVLHPDDAPATAAAWAEARASGISYEVECRYRRQDGVYRWYVARAEPLRDDRGSITAWFGTSTDIHDRKETEAALRETEERYRLASRATNDAIWDWDLVDNHVLWNEALYAVHGYRPEEVAPTGDWWIEHIHHEDRERVAHSIHDVIDGAGTSWSDEYRFRRADGNYADILDRGHVIRDAGGKAVRMIGAMLDLSERRAAEEALLLKSAEFEALADNVSQLAWMAEPNGSIFWYNRRWYEYTGTDLQSMKDWGWRDVHHPDHVERIIEEVQDKWAAAESWEGTYMLRSAEGEYRWFLTRAEPIRDEAGELVRWFGTNTDITAAKRAEERQQFQLSLADRLRELSEPREIVAAAVEVLGRRLGVSRVGYGEVQDDDVTITFETDYVDGVAHLVGTFPTDNFGSGNFVDLRRGLTTVYADLEADSRTAGAGFAAIEAQSAMAVPLIRDGRLRAVLYLNNREIREWSPDEVALVEDVAARTWDALERARAEAEVRELNATLEARVEERTRDLRAAEEALRQAQKMETLGQLTGGVAHDFNNLLQIVSGNLEILRRNLPEDAARLRRVAENAANGADRAAILTQRLLAFSRRQPLAPKAIDPNKLVSGMSELLHRTLGETIAVETVLASGLWRVEADPNQLENAILNLAVNARDAMHAGGKLTIETSNAHLDRAYTAQNAEVAPGQYVVICVSDTGVGMDHQTAERAFEPFFTTKEVGKGTGLGLSMVYGFVKQSGGHLKIYSETGEGTTVKIYLPRLLGDAAEEEQTREALVPEGTSEETILVCEDDDDVRSYSVEVLRELGYRVLEAQDGPAALRLIERLETRLDLLFTDVVLPSGMTGAVLAERARAIRPGLKVLFTTGYARNAIVHQGRLDPGVELITKPFSYSDLAARVRDLLDRRD